VGAYISSRCVPCDVIFLITFYVYLLQTQMLPIQKKLAVELLYFKHVRLVIVKDKHVEGLYTAYKHYSYLCIYVHYVNATPKYLKLKLLVN
jgi:hypothetical protein